MRGGMSKYLSFLQPVPSGTTLRKALTPRKIDEIQNTLDLLFSALSNEGTRENCMRTESLGLSEEVDRVRSVFKYLVHSRNSHSENEVTSR